MKNRVCFLLVGLVILFALSSGCSRKSGLYQVIGTVTLDEQPLTEALVMFSPVHQGNGASACGYTRENGQFEIQTPGGAAEAGTVPGEYYVTLTKTESRWDGHSYHYDEVSKSKTQDKVTHGFEVLPKIYTSKETTPFTVVVEKKKNEFTFELKSKL